jgi:uncharacterized protein YlxW (UPF0749 family)
VKEKEAELKEAEREWQKPKDGIFCPLLLSNKPDTLCRVKEKEAELKEAERELHNRFDKLKASVADEKRSVEEQRRALDEEIAEFQVTI